MRMIFDVGFGWVLRLRACWLYQNLASFQDALNGRMANSSPLFAFAATGFISGVLLFSLCYILPDQIDSGMASWFLGQ